MLSLFPELFNYSQIAPLLLRISLAIVLLLSIKDWPNKFFASLKILTAFLLAIGLFIQPAAIIILLILISEIIARKKGELVVDLNIRQIILIMAISLSLLFIGPGLFSLDLPL